jgi:pimeloyl-ACP methyl ester carboxylesterase
VLEHLLEREGASIYGVTSGPDEVGAGAGRTAPFLVLDGIGCSGWAFKRIVPALARSHSVTLMHYRGHGRSPTPLRPWRFGLHDLADDAAALLDRLGLERAIIVGFSMGFQVALELARRHPTRVAGLVSLAGPAGRVLSQFQGTELFAHLLPIVRGAARFAHDWTGRMWRTLLPSKWIPMLGLHTQLNAMRIELDDLAFYLRQMSEMDPELFLLLLDCAHRHCADDVLDRIRVPTLVIAGKNDTFVPLAVMRKMAFSIPGAQWTVFDEASHALPAEFPDEVAERLLAFAADVRP